MIGFQNAVVAIGNRNPDRGRRNQRLQQRLLPQQLLLRLVALRHILINRHQVLRAIAIPNGNAAAL